LKGLLFTEALFYLGIICAGKMKITYDPVRMGYTLFNFIHHFPYF